jgi:hypothetical protein
MSDGVNGSAPVNGELVLALSRLLAEARAGRVVNAVAVVMQSHGGPGVMMVSGPGGHEIYSGLGIAQRMLLETLYAPAIDQMNAAAAMRRAQAGAVQMALPPGFGRTQ